MKRAGITEAKNNLSALLERVKAGETVVIEDRGVPIATLEPLAGHPERADIGRLERLEQQGLVRRARGKVPRAMLDLPPVKLKAGYSLVQALLEERRSGR